MARVSTPLPVGRAYNPIHFIEMARTTVHQLRPDQRDPQPTFCSSWAGRPTQRRTMTTEPPFAPVPRFLLRCTLVANGTKPTSWSVRAMSAFGDKADIGSTV